MTNLTKYQPSQAYIANMRASGFDAHDPNLRHPVQNLEAEQVLAARKSPRPTHNLAARDNRADALLKARGGQNQSRNGPARSYGFALLAIVPLFLSFEIAVAEPPMERLGGTPTPTVSIEKQSLELSSPVEISEAPEAPTLEALIISIDETATGTGVATLPLPELAQAKPAFTLPTWLQDLQKIDLLISGISLIFILFLLSKLSKVSRLMSTQPIQSTDRKTSPKSSNTAEGKATNQQRHLFADEYPQPNALKPTSSTKKHKLSRVLREAGGWKWYIKGATRKGLIRAENQDAFCLYQPNSDHAFFGVFDGMGGLEGGALAAKTAASTALELAQDFAFQEGAEPLSFLSDVIALIRDRLDSEGHKGATTAILGLLVDDLMHFATVGDGGLAVIWPDGMVTDYLAPHHLHGHPSNMLCGYLGQDNQAPPRVGTVKLEPDCFVMAMSDGISEIISLDKMAAQRKATANRIAQPSDKIAASLLKALEDARDPNTQAYVHSDNMTLVMAALERTYPKPIEDEEAFEPNDEQEDTSRNASLPSTQRIGAQQFDGGA